VVATADFFLLIALRSHQEFESVLPPYPLAKLLLVVEIRTQEQGLTDRPAMRREFSITGLLKSEFIDLPTDRIRAPHISFDLFCRKIEKASNIKFDAARDELGWVQELLGLGDKQQHCAISCELTFQNALGMMRLSTTQTEPPQALIIHLWSPAPRESIFRRSRREPLPRGRPVSDDLESEANSQQPSGSTTPPVINPVIESEANSQEPSGSTMPLVINPVLNRSAKEENSQKPSGSSTPPFMNSISIRSAETAEADVEMTTLPLQQHPNTNIPEAFKSPLLTGGNSRRP
jgi:hypothetical protein